RGTRRIGLGVTGLADTLIMCGRRYDQPEGRELAAGIFRRVRDASYRASIELARDRGAYPFYDRAQYLKGAYFKNLPPELQVGIVEYGIRNSQLMAIA